MTAGHLKPESVKAGRPVASPDVATRPTAAVERTSAAPVPGHGQAPNAGQVLTLQRAIGNAAVSRLLRRPSVTVARGGPAKLQRVREGEFRADPAGFLKKYRVTVETAKGLKLRYPADVHAMFYEKFVRMMDAYKFSRHWFVLQHNPEEDSYIVTPAIEKYLEHDPAWAQHVDSKLLEAVKKGPVGATKDHITAAYFPYFFGAPSEKDFGGTVGHTDLTKKPGKGDGADEFNPDFAFTGFMNGCAFTVTPVPQDPSKFTIWHFQSSTANKQMATTFRMENRPIEWFGEDEYYPRGVEAEGVIPKVTNFLYRRDGVWHVASQVNYSDAATGKITKGTPKPVTRPLNVDEGGGPPPLVLLRRIYLEGMQYGINVRLRRSLDVCKEHQAVIKEHQVKGIEGRFEAFDTGLRKILADEEHQLDAAIDVRGLHEVALGIRKTRDDNAEILDGALNSLHKAYTRMAEIESETIKSESSFSNFFFGRESRRAAYADIRARLEAVRSFYKEDGWIDELIKETTPPASSGDAGPEGSKVAAPEIPPDSSGPGKERESGDVSKPSVLSSDVPVVAPIVIGQLPAVAPPSDAVFAFLDGLSEEWNVAEVPRADGGGDGGSDRMNVGVGSGVMLGAASQAKLAGPVAGETLPVGVDFLRNNGNGAWCFVYSIVMGLTGLQQSDVEGVVRWIVATAGVQQGWIASDTPAARQVLDVVQQVLGIPVQVIELQHSVDGFIISGRSHNVTRQARRPVVLRNTGGHYDAIV